MDKHHDPLAELDFSRWVPESPAHIPIPDYLAPAESTAHALHETLRSETERLTQIAPQDHDILVIYENLLITHVTLRDEIFLFQGVDQAGRPASAVCHHTALRAHIRVLPKPGHDNPRPRVCTGFDRPLRE